MVHVIKVYFEEGKKETQIRRLAVSSDTVGTFQLLKQKVQELFPGLKNKEVELKWKDSENDFIHMSSDAELAQALANAEDGLLKIYAGLLQEKLENSSQSRANTVLHPNVVCDGCEKVISGNRFKCLQCPDFDLCSACDAGDKHLGHDLIKLVKPAHVPREWVFLGSRKLWKSMFHQWNHRCGRDSGEKKTNETPEDSTKAGNAEAGPSNQQSAFKAPDVLSAFMDGDFVKVQKLLNDNLGHILGDVEVKLGTCPFKAEFKHNKPRENKEKKEKHERKCNSPSSETPPQADQSPSVEKKDAVLVDLDSKAESSAPLENMNESASADDWTLLQGDEASKEASAPPSEGSTEPKLIYPDIEQHLKDSQAKKEKELEISSGDPKIIEAALVMQAMGFTNEGGWLERLLITKDGNINEALDALYPVIH